MYLRSTAFGLSDFFADSSGGKEARRRLDLLRFWLQSSFNAIDQLSQIAGVLCLADPVQSESKMVSLHPLLILFLLSLP